MDSLAELVALAKAGHFAGGNRPIIATSPNAANDSPTSPVAAPDSLPATQPLPPALERATAALTAAERARLTPTVCAALVAECPDSFPDFPPEAARRWVAERLGLSVRFWNVTRNGRRWRVEFTEPQTRAGLLEQAARNQPGESLELEPALLLPALRDNAPIAVSDNDKPPTEPLPDNAMQQALLLPDNAPIEVSDTAPAPAGRWLEQAGVSVRYVADGAQLERALSELAALPEHGGPWGLDIETMPLPAFTRDKAAGLDPWRSSIRLAQVYPGGDACYVFDVAALGLSPLVELLRARPLVAHNAVFEWKFLLHAGADPRKLGCTLLQANALRGDRPGLATLAAELLGWRLDKTLQVSDWGGALSGAQLDYAALDAVAAWRLARELSGRLKDTGRGRCYGLMRDAQRAIAALERAGCPFDTAAHSALLATWQTQAESARGELDSLLNGANPDSPLQLSRWLAANLPPDTVANWPKTAGGQLQTDADAMAGLSLPALDPLRRYKVAVKLLGTYGQGYAAHISPVTGRIHASFALGGTATGRLACRSPNIQNPPRGAEFRALFAPKAGRVFVVADYSQIELRVAALVSGDSAMLAAYEAGEDLHRKTAAAVLGIEPGAVTKGQRQMAKACIAAGSLVLTDAGLVPIEQVTRNHLLWDGVSWVSHDGVVYQGYRQVMTYDGLTATPDHVVFLETGDPRLFAEAANSGGLSLARGEFEGNPVRFLGSSRGTGNRKTNGRGNPDTAAAIRALLLPCNAENQAGKSGKSATEPFDWGTRGRKSEVSTSLSRPGGTSPDSDIRRALRCHLSTLQQPESRMVSSLRRAGYPVTIQRTGTFRELGTGEPTPRNLSGCPDRPDRQQPTLRTWQLAAGIAATEPTEHAAQSLLPLSRDECSSSGLVALVENGLPGLFPIADPNGKTGGPGDSCQFDTDTKTETKWAHVYDILNAGPRNRFTVSGCIVHNCNFGLLFGQGSKGLQRYAQTAYEVDMTLAEAERARAAFFKAYPGLSRWQTETRRNAERAGQVRTPGGRVRALEGQRALATESLNTPIQGGAAECLLATLAALELDSLGAQLVNVVHDELIVECDPEQAGAVAAEVERAMVAGFLAIFPDGCTRDLVEAHSGPNWAAAKG